jgi:hypothetical protein
MSEVKIILKRSPRDPENGVWIDGVKVPDVKHVVITLVPKQITMGLDSPDVDMVPDDHKN